MLKLEMSNINKSFFGVKVLHNVSLKVHKGSIHALIGENGAGKSTLMNILGGVYTLDSGIIKIDGNEVSDMTVNKAEANGVAFVHQEINLFNNRLEIISPGSLVGSKWLKNEKDLASIPPLRRNEVICNVFYICKLMEKRGSGFDKIEEEYLPYDKKYRPYLNSNNFIITPCNS